MHRLIRPTSNQRATDKDGGRRSIERVEKLKLWKQGFMSREKTRQPKCHCSALSQQNQNSDEITDICTKLEGQEHKPETGRPRRGQSMPKTAGVTSAHPKASAGTRRTTSVSAPPT
ncbi:hypothetical protein K438DRAFT_1758793 [Mycena galopus ATCC 62051]|nr:hypothetical protein K438DRAFT_1758793 [Mycena galopus ATCC 62051]